MIDFTKEISGYYQRLMKVLGSLDLAELNAAMNVLFEAYQTGATIYTCGNGGSASTASHLMNDFNKGISYNLKKKFQLCCLSDNIATITAIANDDNYNFIYSKQLEGKVKKEDVLLAISGSGNSVNIIEAVKEAKKVGAKVLGMTGYDGGRLYELSDVHMHVPTKDMQLSEDIHLTFNHMMMQVFGEKLKVR